MSKYHGQVFEQVHFLVCDDKAKVVFTIIMHVKLKFYSIHAWKYVCLLLLRYYFILSTSYHSLPYIHLFDIIHAPICLSKLSFFLSPSFFIFSNVFCTCKLRKIPRKYQVLLVRQCNIWKEDVS